MPHIVYMARCISTGKLYFGITKRSLTARWRAHVTAANRGSSYYFHRAIRKYGPDGFDLKLIETVHTLGEAISREIYFIAEHSSLAPRGYNSTSGGNCPTDISAESKRKMSIAARNRSPEQRAKLKAAWQAKLPGFRHRLGKFTAEHKLKLAQRLRTIRPPKPSQATRQKMSASHRRRLLTKQINGASLSPDQVREIRAMHKEDDSWGAISRIARQLNVSKATARNVIRGIYYVGPLYTGPQTTRDGGTAA